MSQLFEPPTERGGQVPLDIPQEVEINTTSVDGNREAKSGSTQIHTIPDPIEDQEPPVPVIPDEVYDKYTPRKKAFMVALLSYCAFLSAISSTSTLSATPEIAAEFHTTGSILNISSALYILLMGLSPMLWGPLSQVIGRRMITLVTATAFVIFSIATALVPEIVSFFVARILTAIAGTSLTLAGSAVISDIYRPVERGTATGWLLSGMLVGPAFGPFISGVIVTFVSWRNIFWLQTALAGVALIGVYFILPETIFHRKLDDLEGYSAKKKALHIMHMINPWKVLRLWQYPNVVFTGLASSALLWNMYGLLAPIRYVLNPRYGLETPLQGGLFYLSPGLGYVIGTFLGGRYADYTVKKYIKKRGVRIPEDRLISAVPFMLVISVCILIYGWTVEMAVGGIPLTVIVMFVQGVSQLFCFPSLNAYCLDVIPGRGGEVIAANFTMRYLFATISTAVVLPAIEAIGVGWYSTITFFILIAATGVTVLTIRNGPQMRDRLDARRNEKAKEADNV
ncbi:major facilitator superfamily domain-containing protein [Hypoxylon cercidicola]|nr:major facilitator superfamily domain-containing protein [Hypoxylon cercidicola]